MLETELFELFEHTADAMYAVTATGEICAWNTAAEQLFGHPAADVLHRNIDEVLEARDALGTPALAGGSEAATRQWRAAAGGIPNFDLEVCIRSGERIWINVSTIVFDNHRTGRRLFVRLARDMNERRLRERAVVSMLDAAKHLISLAEPASGNTPTEPLSEQERRILKLLADGINSAAIARDLEISPQTVRNHLHHINRKLRTHTRLEAVTHAQRRGLIE